MLVKDFLRRRAAAKAAAGLRKMLREYGFTESEPGRWEGTLTPTINPIEITLPTKKPPRSAAFYALIIVIATLVAVGAVAFGLAWLVAAMTELAKASSCLSLKLKLTSMLSERHREDLSCRWRAAMGRAVGFGPLNFGRESNVQARR
jgi:hypothetical protein